MMTGVLTVSWRGENECTIIMSMAFTEVLTDRGQSFVEG